MGDWWGLPTPFFAFSWFEQIGELFDGENALFLILPLHPRRNSGQQAKVTLLLSLSMARALKGAERTMLIQHDGGWLRRGNSCPCLKRFQEWHEVCGTLIQCDGMGCAVHPNDSSSYGRRVLETSQHIPG